MGLRYIQIRDYMPAVKINTTVQNEGNKTLTKNSLKNRELTQTETKVIVQKLQKLINKFKLTFEDLIVQASSDKEKITPDEFTHAMLKLDNKLDKSQLRGLYNKLDEATLGEI